MPTYDVISTTTVGAVSSVTISGISGYSNVRVVVSGRETSGGNTNNSASYGVRVNGSTASAYSMITNRANNGIPQGVGQKNDIYFATLVALPGSGTPSTARGMAIIDFIDATNRIGGFGQYFSTNETDSAVALSSFYFNSAVALNSITILSVAGNYFQGTTITLYGIN